MKRKIRPLWEGKEPTHHFLPQHDPPPFKILFELLIFSQEFHKP